MRLNFFKLFLLLCLCFSFPMSAFAGYNDYDESVVRAYKSVKIQAIKPNLQFENDVTADEIDLALKNFLSGHKKYQKKNIGKPGIVLYSPQKGGEGVSIDTVYWVENPEKFMFAFDKKASREMLQDRQNICNYIEDNLISYAILSEKIEKQNRSFLKKTVSGTYNGFMNLLIYTPKLGLGYIVNPPMKWLKTTEPGDLYKGITSEVEDLAIGEKEYLEVNCLK